MHPALALLLLLVPAAAFAQDARGFGLTPDSAAVSSRQPGAAPVVAAPPPDPVFSMGMPPAFQPYVVGGGVWDRERSALGGSATVGVYHPLINPIVGVGASLEGSVGWADGVTSSVRGLASLRSLALQVGAEIRLDEKATDLVVSVLPPLRRSGPFGQGGALRVDWVPTRDHSFRVGLTVPVGQRWMGEARRQKADVSLPRAPDDLGPSATPGADVEAALRQASRGAFWLTAFSNAFLDNAGGGNEATAVETFRADVLAWRDSLARRGPSGDGGYPTFAQAEADYHQGLERAFAAAVGPALTDPASAADAARGALLDQVLIPYDRLLGQPKENDSLHGFYPAAHAHFDRWMATESGLDASDQARARDAFRLVLDIAEANRAWILDHWDGDSRQVWLPLQFGLRPDQHDSQGELNALVERVVERPFTSGNFVLPVNNTSFIRDLLTSLHSARDYHVLWVHDISGTDKVGQPDAITHRVSTEGYLSALTQAVQRYDETGTIPTFLVFLDEKSYAATDGGIWLRLLQDPLRHQVGLPAGSEEMEAGVRRAQAALRAAVAGSSRLQADAASRTRGWLRDVVKVHVNVTFPSDFSFRSSNLVTWMPDWMNLLPDELMRDHRKVAFYDITETDPRRGLGLLAGTGVGEQYASPTWEDRGVLTGGPALVALKDAARTLLLGQGFSEDEVPPPLRRQAKPDNYDQLVAALDAEGADAVALNVHNGVGFAAKQATLAQAVLYTTMPAGCVIYVPDSLWLSGFWAGQLIGASFRGCAVRIISPALANAPSDSGPVMARSHALTSRLLVVQNEMQDVFAQAGGDLRVGLYTRKAAIDDLPAVLREAQQGFDEAPWLRDEFPLSDDVFDLLSTFSEQLVQGGFKTDPLIQDVEERLPKLHRKTQLLAMRPVIQEIGRELDVDLVRQGLIARAEGAALPDSQPLAARVGAAYPFVSRVALLPDSLRDQSVFFSMVGSMNKDPRSMLLDGETLHIVAGPWSMVHYPDFMLLLGRTTWLQDQQQVDDLIPPYSRLNRWLSSIVRDLL